MRWFHMDHINSMTHRSKLCRFEHVGVLPDSANCSFRFAMPYFCQKQLSTLWGIFSNAEKRPGFLRVLTIAAFASLLEPKATLLLAAPSPYPLPLPLRFSPTITSLCSSLETPAASRIKEFAHVAPSLLPPTTVNQLWPQQNPLVANSTQQHLHHEPR